MKFQLCYKYAKRKLILQIALVNKFLQPFEILHKSEQEKKVSENTDNEDDLREYEEMLPNHLLTMRRV